MSVIGAHSQLEERRGLRLRTEGREQGRQDRIGDDEFQSDRQRRRAHLRPKRWRRRGRHARRLRPFRTSPIILGSAAASLSERSTASLSFRATSATTTRSGERAAAHSAKRRQRFMIALVGRLDRQRSVVDLARSAVDRDGPSGEGFERCPFHSRRRRAGRARDRPRRRATCCRPARSRRRAMRSCHAGRPDWWSGVASMTASPRMRAPFRLVGVANDDADADAGRGALAGGQSVAASSSADRLM